MSQVKGKSQFHQIFEPLSGGKREVHYPIMIHRHQTDTQNSNNVEAVAKAENGG